MRKACFPAKLKIRFSCENENQAPVSQHSRFASEFKMKKNILVILLCFCVFVYFSNSAFALKKRKPVEVEFKSYDGFKLVGTLDIPNYASVKNKVPLVIFLHSICSSHLAWGDFPQEVKNSLNVATLNLDLRGHGKSIKDKQDRYFD